MKNIEFSGKSVLEIGPGDISHIKFWKNNPKEYVLADVSESMMNFATQRLKKKNIEYRTLKVERNKPLPIENQSIDIILSFYSLEYIYPLDPFIKEACRLLKPNGRLIGAIPAEGGFAWDFGRSLTSKRWLKKNTTIDQDKIICWEHPNFADKIISRLNNKLTKQKIKCWLFSWAPLLDINLVIRFIYKKASLNE